jgi:L-aminopeptidase/D-esterase-like protein
VAGVDVRGGGPGTRETDLLDPRNLVERVHAVVLSGGSAFGLAAADGVMRGLLTDGVGFPMGAPHEVVPIVPGAVIFDLGRGGRFDATPGPDLGAAAYAAASTGPVPMGCVGAGTGAQCGGLKGGIGSASVIVDDGTTVAALVVVNAVGSSVEPGTGELYAVRLGLDGEFAGVGTPDAHEVAAAGELAAARNATGTLPSVLATTIGVIATDAALTKAQCAKVSGIGHDGLARAIRPVHTMLDGDTLFTMATGERSAPDLWGFQRILEVAADCVTRAVGHAMLAASSVEVPYGTLRSYGEAFPSAFRG